LVALVRCLESRGTVALPDRANVGLTRVNGEVVDVAGAGCNPTLLYLLKLAFYSDYSRQVYDCDDTTYLDLEIAALDIRRCRASQCFEEYLNLDTYALEMQPTGEYTSASFRITCDDPTRIGVCHQYLDGQLSSMPRSFAKLCDTTSLIVLRPMAE